MEENITKTILNCSQKLKKFQKAKDEEKSISLKQDNFLQQKINEEQKDFENRIIKMYKEYSEPKTKEIEAEEEELLTAYKLYKGLLELNENLSSDKTFLSDFKINSSILRNYPKEKENNFFFLQTWFIFEKEITDFIPEILRKENSKTVLIFTKFEDYKMNSFQKEAFEIIKSSI